MRIKMANPGDALKNFDVMAVVTGVEWREKLKVIKITGNAENIIQNSLKGSSSPCKTLTLENS